MKICSIKQTLPGVIEITPDTGSAFFLRTAYLKVVPEERLNIDEEFNDEETSDLFTSALYYSAECAAMTYLSRAEQSRMNLTKKLIHKGIDKTAVKECLDYLESVNYLSDERFASAWLRNRSIDHLEGRIRLSMELASRGISREVIETSLNTFFEDRDEKDLCRKAYSKLLKQKIDSDKIFMSLVRKGFSISDIKKIFKEFK